MKKKLIDYLPPVLKEVEELNNILDVQQSEIYNLKDSVDRMFKDQFIADATEQGLSKWEKIFGIQPKATESESDRKFRIYTRLSEQLVLTLPRLKQQLGYLCNNDYSVSLKEYTLKVRLALNVKSNYDDVAALLKRVVPANIIIDLYLLYNRYMDLNYTHDYLSQYTYKQVRDEKLGA